MTNIPLTHARTCVYNVNYHLVWTVKYRHSLLTATIEQRLKEVCEDIAKEKEFVLHTIEVGTQDHVHVFVSAHPKIAPSYIVKMLKVVCGVSRTQKEMLEGPLMEWKLLP